MKDTIPLLDTYNTSLLINIIDNIWIARNHKEYDSKDIHMEEVLRRSNLNTYNTTQQYSHKKQENRDIKNKKETYTNAKDNPKANIGDNTYLNKEHRTPKLMSNNPNG